MKRPVSIAERRSVGCSSCLLAVRRTVVLYCSGHIGAVRRASTSSVDDGRRGDVEPAGVSRRRRLSSRVRRCD